LSEIIGTRAYGTALGRVRWCDRVTHGVRIVGVVR
jgi:hypothetical protein